MNIDSKITTSMTTSSPQQPLLSPRSLLSPRNGGNTTPRSGNSTPRSWFGNLLHSEQKTPESIGVKLCCSLKGLSRAEKEGLTKICNYVMKKIFDYEQPKQEIIMFSPSVNGRSIFQTQSSKQESSPEIILSEQKKVDTPRIGTPRISYSPLNLLSPRTPRKTFQFPEKLKDLQKIVKMCWKEFQTEFVLKPSTHETPVRLSVACFKEALKEPLKDYMSLQTISKVIQVMNLLKEIKITETGDDKAIETSDQLVQSTATAFAESIKEFQKEHERVRSIVLDISYLLGLTTVTDDPLKSKGKQVLTQSLNGFLASHQDYTLEFLLYVQTFERMQDPEQALILLEKIYETYLPHSTSTKIDEQVNNKEINVDEKVVKEIKDQLDILKQNKQNGVTLVMPTNLFSRDLKIGLAHSLKLNFIDTPSSLKRDFKESDGWKKFEFEYLGG